jgi:O-succinylbenzoic acid--CoA ligase
VPSPGEAPLVATLLRARELAAALPGMWEDGEAVLPLDPASPAAVTARLISTLRPTHLVDRDGRRALAHGVPVDDDIVAVVATSGTTGEPKGVELTRDGAVLGARAYAEGIGATTDDRWLGCLPLHHVAGLAVVPRSIYTGIPATVHDGFDADRVAGSPEREGTTIVLVVGTMLRRLLDAGAPLARFRTVLVGAGPLAPDLRERCDTLGVHAVNTYGMTEAWGGVAFDGVPIPGMELRVADDGEILVRGTLVMRGYRLRPDLTAEVLDADGWYRTGDVGAIVDGALVVTDRLRELVKSGGVTVSPTEVEQVLVRHGDVVDVCVVGVPDAEWGERVVAVVVPADAAAPPSLEALRAFARDHLAAAKLPREVRYVDTIPRSASGKPLRRLLTAV